MRVAAVIFTGGKASRLGGIDKGSLNIGGVSAFAHTAGTMGAANAVFTSVAHDFAGTYYRGCPVIADNKHHVNFEETHPGVSLSILTALEFIAKQGYDVMIMAPVDTPFLPDNYAERLLTALGKKPVTVICAGRVHGLHAALPIAYLDTVRREFVDNGLRRVTSLHKTLGSNHVEFSEAQMRNLNRPEDLKSLS